MGRRVVADLVRDAGHLDYFFNNAGIGFGGEVERYGQREWDDVLDVNLRGVTHGIQAVYPVMIAQGHGHIVNTASMAGLMPMPGGASYTASKHAVVGMSKALRIEGSFHGVRVSVLCPGAIRTPILEGGRYGSNELMGIDAAVQRAQWEKLRPMDPRVFAEQVLDEVARNAPYIIVPRWWRAIWLVERLSPRLSLWLARGRHAVIRKHMRPRSTAAEDRGSAGSPTAGAARGG